MPDGAAAARIADNLSAIRGRVTEACRRAGRDAAGVTLIAVTKYVDAATARLVHAAGCVDLAESRPQSLWAKAESLADLVPPPRWHLVGHLQRNKVRRTIGLVTLLHSLDSLRLAEAIDAEAAVQRRLCDGGKPCDVLVEVNLAGDPGRTGVAEPEVEPLLVAVGALPHIRVRGLMGMASVPEGPEAGATARRQFARLRNLRDRLRERLGGDTPGELSMGMSDDFEEAILEGATLVRVGSLLWEGLTAS